MNALDVIYWSAAVIAVTVATIVVGIGVALLARAIVEAWHER